MLDMQADVTLAQGPTVTIGAAALDVIAAEGKQSADGLETGGILLGHDTGDDIAIAHAGGPGARAQRGPRFFLRDLNHAQAVAAAAWDVDKSQWIGEWHTHPSGPLAPSERDLLSYQTHLRDAELAFDRFVSLIVVLEPEGLAITTWIIDSHTARPVALRRGND